MAAFGASDETRRADEGAAGSDEAFAALVRRHQAAVRWTLVRYVRDPATADDLAQEVFLAAYQNLETCRSLGNVRGWLLGIARNTALEHLRAASRQRLREQGELARQLAQWRMEQLEQGLEQEHEQERTFETLRRCLERLAPESRRVVEEHYFQRQTVESIAQRQGREAGTVRMMLLRIRKTLGECIRSLSGSLR